jgi:hypothetical protein
MTAIFKVLGLLAALAMAVRLLGAVGARRGTLGLWNLLAQRCAPGEAGRQTMVVMALRF